MKNVFLILFTTMSCLITTPQAMDAPFAETSEREPIKVCVFCSADDKIPENFKEAAVELGKNLALINARLITGGSNTGLMKSVVDGYATVKPEGEVYGVLPDVLKEHQIEHPLIPKENVIWAKDMPERFKKYHELSNACVVLPGGFGTLHELMDYLVSDQFGIHKTTIVLANYNNYWDPLLLMFRQMMDAKALYFKHFDILKIAYNVGEVIEHLKSGTTAMVHDGLRERFWEDSPHLPKETYGQESLKDSAH